MRKLFLLMKIYYSKCNTLHAEAPSNGRVLKRRRQSVASMRRACQKVERWHLFEYTKINSGIDVYAKCFMLVLTGQTKGVDFVKATEDMT